jgi:hypothetical protein
VSTSAIEQVELNLKKMPITKFGEDPLRPNLIRPNPIPHININQLIQPTASNIQHMPISGVFPFTAPPKGLNRCANKESFLKDSSIYW